MIATVRSCSRSRNTPIVTSRGGSSRRNRSGRSDRPMRLRNATRADTGSNRSARAPTDVASRHGRDPVVRRVAVAGPPSGDDPDGAELPQQPEPGDVPLLEPDQVGLRLEHLMQRRARVVAAEPVEDVRAGDDGLPGHGASVQVVEQRAPARGGAGGRAASASERRRDPGLMGAQRRLSGHRVSTRPSRPRRLGRGACSTCLATQPARASQAAARCTPGRIRTYAPASGGRCSIP